MAPTDSVAPTHVSFDRLWPDALVASGHVTEGDLDRARQAAALTGLSLRAALLDLGLVSPADALRTEAAALRLDVLTAPDLPPVALDVAGLSSDFLRAHAVVPLLLTPDTLTVAMTTTEDAYLLKALSLASGRRLVVRLASAEDIAQALNPGPSAEGESDGTPIEDSDSKDFVEHLRDLASEVPVIRSVNQIVARVVDLRASDIHLEPAEDGLHVRYRVDGVMAPHEVIPAAQSAATLSRVKLLAQLDIAERRLPQDGRIKTRVKGRELDLRVSCVPTVHGESVVMRVLDRGSVNYTLDAIGFEPDRMAGFNALLARPHGVLLITGPTGSGKTTTLYTALSKLDASALKIITVEDPVEYQLAGINQIQVHPQIGLSFGHALRAILRQDPDVVMIGEMRDAETAQIAVQAALTGHMVLSTLHTNTAAGAVTRLKDLGVDPYLITSAVNGVLAQRLVRRLCPDCRKPFQPSDELLARSGLAQLAPTPTTLYEPGGCTRCRGTGYLGRCGIHELLPLSDKLRQAVLDGADTRALQAIALADGMTTLYMDGLLKVARGWTSLEELLRVTESGNDG